MKRFLIRLASSLLLVVALISAFGYWLIGTAPGTRTLSGIVTTLAQRQQLDFAIINTDGNLLDGLIISGLRYQDRSINLGLKEITLQVVLSELLRGRLHIKSLETEGLTVSLTLGKDSAPRENTQQLVELPFELIIDNANFVTSSISTDVWSVDIEQVTLQGNNTLFNLDATGSIVAGSIPTLPFKLAASGDFNQLDSVALHIVHNSQSVQISGSLRLFPRLMTPQHLQIEMNAINPATWSNQQGWNGSLNAKIICQISDTGQTNLAVSIEKLDGDLRGYPVTGSGKAYFMNNEVIVDNLLISSGSNNVFVNGTVGEQLALNFNIKLPEIAALLPDAEGTFNAQGVISGTPTSPTFDIKADGRGIRYTDNIIGHFTLNAELLATDEPHGIIQLEANEISHAQFGIDSIVLHIDGNLDSHDTHLTAISSKSPLTKMKMDLLGHFTDDQWNGSLKTLDLQTASIGSWSLEQAIDLQISKQHIEVAELCLLSTGSETACVSGEMVERQLDISGHTDALQLQTLVSAFTRDVQATGVLNSRFTAKGALAKPEITLDILPMQGNILLPVQEDLFQTVNYALEKTHASLDLGSNRGLVNLKADFGQFGRGTMHIVMENGDLSGNGLLSIDDIAWLERLAPKYVREVKGSALLEAVLSGTMKKPRITITGALNNGSLRSPLTGTTIESITLNLTHADTAALISGKASSGLGNIQLNGKLDLATQNIDIKVTGDRFEGIRKPQAQVLVSPNLIYTRTDKVTRIDGDILIPEATISIHKISSQGIAVSPDERIIGAVPHEREGNKTVPFDLDINMRLGEKVHLEAFGVNADLGGQVKLTQAGQNLLANGRITLRDGTFKAYGQHLTIDSGALLLTGNPENPLFDLEAYRDSNDRKVRAIVRATGSVNNPKLQISSIPNLPESEALSYLLTGRGMEQANTEQANAIYLAALKSGIADPMLTNMRDTLGLDEFGVTTTSENTTAFGFGKHISPRLYVGYSVGLFESISELLLRFQLTDHLELSSRSGENQSLDLYYLLEHN